jgi:hypothetical protein
MSLETHIQEMTYGIRISKTQSSRILCLLKSIFTSIKENHGLKHKDYDLAEDIIAATLNE